MLTFIMWCPFRHATPSSPVVTQRLRIGPGRDDNLHIRHRHTKGRARQRVRQSIALLGGNRSKTMWKNVEKA